MSTQQHSNNGFEAPEKPRPDYLVQGHGSVYLLRPLNDAAAANLTEHTGTEHQFFGEALVVEHRYIADLVEHLQQEGWRIN